MVTKKKLSKVRDVSRHRDVKTVGLCGECSRVVPVLAFHTLTVHGGQPTLGVCEFVTNRRVLLSEKGCDKFVRRYGL